MKEENKNPYLDGKRVWNEAFGNQIAQKRNWQIVAFISLIITFIAVAGTIYLATQNKIIPYVVQVDKLGRALASGPADQVNIKNLNVTKSALANFITNWRSSWGDNETQKNFILEAYKYLMEGSEAYKLVSQEYRKNDPFKRLQKERIHITVNSILTVGENRWQIDWTEKTTSKSDEVDKTATYKGLFIVKQIVPTSINEIINNPLGNYITDISYSKLL